VDFRLGARATANDDARITGKGHQEIARISHATRNNDAGRPIRWRHLIRRHDAQHQAVGRDGTLGSHPSRWAAAAAHDRDTELRERFARLAGELIRT
jgi:hypothetical protein